MKRITFATLDANAQTTLLMRVLRKLWNDADYASLHAAGDFTDRVRHHAPRVTDLEVLAGRVHRHLLG